MLRPFSKIRLGLSLTIATLISAITLGCVTTPIVVSPEKRKELLKLVKNGQPFLDCREFSCVAAWASNRQKFITLHNAGQWEELAVQVGATGYKNNLSYYYLGRAAEGMSWWEAANRFYRVSNTLTYTQYACNAGGFYNCDLISFPDDLVIRMAAVEAGSRKAANTKKNK